jgi:hypothetical protein
MTHRSEHEREQERARTTEMWVTIVVAFLSGVFVGRVLWNDVLWVIGSVAVAVYKIVGWPIDVLGLTGVWAAVAAILIVTILCAAAGFGYDAWRNRRRDPD